LSFQIQLAVWKENLVDPDPMDLDQHEKALRPATVAWKINLLMRFASILVRSGKLKASEITDFSILLNLENFKAGVRAYRARFDNKQSSYVGSIATTLLGIARHQCSLEIDHLEQITAITKRLQPKKADPLTPRNRERLSQFDNPQNVVKLLAFPMEERARGLKTKNPERRAKYIERALMAALLKGRRTVLPAR
jgi:hypothetical protein